MDLDLIEKYLNDAIERLAIPPGAQILCLGADTMNPCVRLDFETADRMSRLTVWRNGQILGEQIDVNSGEFTVHEYSESGGLEDLEALLCRLRGIGSCIGGN